MKSNTACRQFHVNCESLLSMKGKLIKMLSVFAKKCNVIAMVLHNLYPSFLGGEITHPRFVIQSQLYFSVYSCGQMYKLRYTPDLR